MSQGKDSFISESEEESDPAAQTEGKAAKADLPFMNREKSKGEPEGSVVEFTEESDQTDVCNEGAEDQREQCLPSQVKGTAVTWFDEQEKKEETEDEWTESAETWAEH